jgi:hypothetical protein
MAKQKIQIFTNFKNLDNIKENKISIFKEWSFSQHLISNFSHPHYNLLKIIFLIQNSLKSFKTFQLRDIQNLFNKNSFEKDQRLTSSNRPQNYCHKPNFDILFST